MNAVAIGLLALTVAALPVSAMADAPKGWFVAGNNPGGYNFGKEHVADSGSAFSAFIQAKTPNATGFGTLMQYIRPDNYLGKRVRLSARLKTADADHAQMWLRVDGEKKGESLAFYNMDDRPVTGTTGWKRYEIVLDVPRGAVGVAFGMFLAGKGEMWADDFKLEIVDTSVPVSAAPSGLRDTPANLNFDQ